MLKRFFATLTLCVSVALALSACGGTDNTATNTAGSNTSNSTKTTTTTTTTTSTPATTTSTPATTTPASGDKIGVAECDDYLEKYEACISSKVPAAARAQYESSMKTLRDSWRSAAATPQGKAGLAAACKAATEQARTSMKSFGCNF